MTPVTAPASHLYGRTSPASQVSDSFVWAARAGCDLSYCGGLSRAGSELSWGGLAVGCVVVAWHVGTGAPGSRRVVVARQRIPAVYLSTMAPRGRSRDSPERRVLSAGVHNLTDSVPQTQAETTKKAGGGSHSSTSSSLRR